MKMLTLLTGSLLIVASTEILRAENATNARQLAELRALSFTSAQKVFVAKLSAPVNKEEAAFRGCALRSEWKEVAAPEGQVLADVLRSLISDGISSYTKAGDDDIVWLQPFGFAYGVAGVRLETDRGRREFSVTLGNQTDYVYAYDTRKHTMCFVLEGALLGKIGKILPSKLTETPHGK